MLRSSCAQSCSGAPQGLYRDRNFREGFAGLAALGLSFDAWLFQTQLDDVTDLARAFPQAVARRLCTPC